MKISAWSTFKDRKMGKTIQRSSLYEVVFLLEERLSAVVGPAWEWFGTSAAEITLLSLLSGVGKSNITAARPGTL